MTVNIETSAVRSLSHVIGHDVNGLFGRSAIRDLTGAPRPSFRADFRSRRYESGRAISEIAAFTFTRASRQFAPVAGVPQAVAANTPVFDARGMVLEPQKTNLAPNPQLDGAAVGIVGSGGALPANLGYECRL